jgi:acyl-CoA dehydrogenase
MLNDADAFPPPLRPIPQWISGAGDPRNRIHILIGLSDPSNPDPHKRHTIVLIPPNTPGVKIVRPMTVMGYDDAPEGHCEVLYDEVRLKEKDCLVGGWGRGFEVGVF